jgi:hypothetical protein
VDIDPTPSTRHADTALVAICSDPDEVRELLAPSTTRAELWSSHDAARRTWLDAGELVAGDGATAHADELVVRLPLDGPSQTLSFALEWIADRADLGAATTVTFVAPLDDEPPGAHLLRAVRAAGLRPGVDVRTCLRSLTHRTVWVPGVHGLARLTVPAGASARDLAQTLSSLVPLPAGSPIPARLHRLAHAATDASDPAWCVVLAAAYIESILAALGV